MLSVETLRTEFPGRVIAPDDAEYDKARMILFGGIDKHPAVIIKVRAADDGPVRTAEPGFTVTKLNDQHAFLALSDGAHVAVGDLVAFGISHPCTAFQLWREALVADDADRILEVYELRF